MEMQPPEGKKFYGSVTVSERGQIVVPAEARKDFGINAGDKLLVFGDLAQGLWIAPLSVFEKQWGDNKTFFSYITSRMKPADE